MGRTIQNVFSNKNVRYYLQINVTLLNLWSTSNGTVLKELPNSLIINSTLGNSRPFLFEKTEWSDQAIGGVLLAIALVMMSTCLVLIVKVLKSSLEGRLKKLKVKLFKILTIVIDFRQQIIFFL